MELVTIFYQAEGLASVEVIEVEREATITSVRETLGKKHAWASEVALFAEDADEPIVGLLLVRDIEVAAGTKLHAHRCRRVRVRVVGCAGLAHAATRSAAAVATSEQWPPKAHI